MVYLKQSSCSAAIAFSPSEDVIATGTYVGTTDMNFNDFSVLEVRSTDFSRHGKELHVVGGPVGTSAQFQSLAWSKPLEAKEAQRGLIAGSLSDGSLAVWDGSKVIAATAQARIPSLATLGRPNGSPVKGLAFNTLASPNMLATGGQDGDVTIWDLAKPGAPTHGPAAARQGGANGRSAEPEVTTVAWNNKVDHILASAAGGTVTIWDLKARKLRQKFRDTNRNPSSVSALAWNPLVATQIVVAYEEDKHPVLQLWDLRRSASPVFEFLHHTQGILGVSWCPQDHNMLLSTSKDCQTVLWHKDGQKLGDFTSSSYNLDVVWSPTNPGVFATSSCAGGDGQDGSVTMHSLASFKPEPVTLSDGTVDETAPLAVVPNWLLRPAGCSFGFGGKLASFKNERQKVGDHTVNASKISISTVVSEDEAIQLSPEFESTMASLNWESLQQYCENQAANTHGDESETWKFLLLFSEQERTRKILEHLGFSGMVPVPEPVEETVGVEEAAEKLESLRVSETNHVAPQAPRVSVTLPEPEGDDADFFNEDQPLSATASPKPSPVSPRVPKPLTPRQEPKLEPRGPVEKPGLHEERLQRALYVGNYPLAIDICLEANRMADALVVGQLGGGPHFIKAQSEYMKRQPFPYMHIVRAVNDSDLLGFLKSQPLTAWKETLAAIFTHAGSDEVLDLCDALARHLYANDFVHAAILAWICAGNVDQTVRAWTQTLKSQGLEASRLQALVERSVAFFLSTGREDASPALSDLLSQYAGLLASQGNMEDALRYLSLVQTDPTGPAAVLKYRIYNCGAPGIPELDPAPAYPFDDSSTPPPAPEPQPAQPTSTSQPQSRGNQGSSNSYFSQNAYTTSGRYGAAPSYSSAPAAPPMATSHSPTASSQLPASTHNSSGQGRGYQQPSSSTFMVPQQAATKPQPPPTQPAASFQPPPATTGSQFGSSSYSANLAYQAPPQQASFQPVATQSSGAWQQQPSTSEPSLRDWNQTTYSQPQTHFSNPSPSEPSQAPYNAAGPPTYTPAPPKTTSVAQPSVFVPTRTSVPAPAPQQGASAFAAPPAHQPATHSFQPPQPPSPPAPAPQPAPPPARQGPPAGINVNTADVSKVTGDGQLIVKTLKAVYTTCSTATASIPSKKREMDDTSKRLGQLFWKLNNGEVSERVMTNLKGLCQALSSHDYHGATSIQTTLTAQDWDECSAFLTGLKRLIKAAQALGG